MNDVSGTIGGAVFVIAGTTILRLVKEDKWRGGKIYQVIVFAFLLHIALLILSMGLPWAAVILAYLGMVGAFVVNGPVLIEWLGSWGKG